MTEEKISIFKKLITVDEIMFLINNSKSFRDKVKQELNICLSPFDLLEVYAAKKLNNKVKLIFKDNS